MAAESSAEAYRTLMVSRQIEARGIRGRAVLDAMGKVPRHLFVPDGCAPEVAYGDFPLPIGHGQTISQPFIVALMIEMLSCRRGQRVLEIGTGSGYQTAVLAEMGLEVVSLEIVPALAAGAFAILSEVVPGGDFSVFCADGYLGWEPCAPYDGIIVSAAPPAIPPALPAQLAEGARLVLPVGTSVQRLVTVIRRADGFVELPGEHVRFVPMVAGSGGGEAAWPPVDPL